MTLLGSRSYGSAWFWLLLLILWSQMGRSTLGVPVDLVRETWRGRGDPGHPGAEILLDWLSLMLPRWRLAPGEGAFLAGLGTFVLTSLFLLGFAYGLEMAQALFFLLVPLAVRAVTSLRLAARLAPLLDEARRGDLTIGDAAQRAAAMMRRHRMTMTAVTVLATVVTAFWATHWLLMRPFGI